MAIQGVCEPEMLVFISLSLSYASGLIGACLGSLARKGEDFVRSIPGKLP